MKTQEQRSSPLKSHVQSDPRLMAQMKPLHFRSIAPKAPMVASTSTVLSHQPPPALPEPSTAVSPKSIIVPAQKYALMQVAGQGGSFSLVAVPQTPQPPPPQPPPPQQQQIQKNLKLPIPRYQPIRCKRTLEKASGTAQTTCSSAVKVKSESPEQSSELILRTDSVCQTKVLLPESAVLYPGSQTQKPIKPIERRVDSLSNLSYPTIATTATIVAPVANNSPIKAQVERAVSAPSAITVLSPTIFSKPVQIIRSPPKGKLPILPYAKVKNSLLPSTGLVSAQPPGKSASIQAKNLILKSPLDIKAKTVDSSSKSSRLSQDSDATQCKKPPDKKRGRKRKTMEDVLAFEARKKRSLTFFRGRVPDKPPPGTLAFSSQNKVVDISKKYRTIRPKPVLVMETTVPQLVPLPSMPASENVDQEVVMRQQIPGKPISITRQSLVTVQPPGQQPVAEATSGSKSTSNHPRALHRCPTCSRCFQFKHHLQSHLNSHNNLRPYGCPVCRKAYAHSGSLSTHMKLHHAEGRPRKSLRCEFCEKAFGYVGVYFSHLREVHRVILTVEPSISQHEENTPIEGCTDTEEQTSEQHVDPVELQIKCGRCQAITPTFADMKLHLLYVHGEEVQVRLKEGAVHGGREAEDELVKHAAHYWRQLNERRNLVRCGNCDEEFFSFSKLKRHLNSHHQGGTESPKEEQEQEQEQDKGKEHTSGGTARGVTLRAGAQFNCILCSEVLDRKQDVLEHWQERHNCENPAVLWEVLDSRGCGPFLQPKVAS
ncbi:zinc finger protein 438 isoform X1 [Astyanax mexicanus]|uniref:Zinc finger protein 438 n=1 Tax=Astyanax mexicanus TaxID=7994 RepID=A0A8B9L701_ASTMX|nr:zinc finger protein 438 isoform X1 [Astyanax mexicanus]